MREVLVDEGGFAAELIGGLERGHDTEVSFFESGVSGFEFVVGHGPLSELSFYGIAFADGEDIFMAWVFADGGVETDDASGGAFDHLEEEVLFVEEDAGDTEATIVHAGVFEEFLEFAFGKGVGCFADIDDAVEIGSCGRGGHDSLLWGDFAADASE